MKVKILAGTILILTIILLSIFSSVTADPDNNINNQKLQNIKEYINNKIDKISDTLWYPGFFITLLLAPFIILYLIIAIILDIGNP